MLKVIKKIIFVNICFMPELICWGFIGVNMRCYTYISSNRNAVCVSGSICPQSQAFSRHSCWLPFWGTADICLLSPSDTLLGMGLWHFWLSVCLCVWVCVCVCMHVYACVMSYLGMPPDILLDANGIHCHGSWRGGGHRCLCLNGACRSPVGVCMCVCMLWGSMMFPWHTHSVGWSYDYVCVYLWVFLNVFVCWQEIVFVLCPCSYLWMCSKCECASASVWMCVFVWAVSGLLSSRACMCVSGGQADKGACFFLIRTPTSTSLSLYCSTSLLSILLPFSFLSKPVVTPLSLSLSLSLSLCTSLSLFPCIPLFCTFDAPALYGVKIQTYQAHHIMIPDKKFFYYLEVNGKQTFFSV